MRRNIAALAAGGTFFAVLVTFCACAKPRVGVVDPAPVPPVPPLGPAAAKPDSRPVPGPARLDLRVRFDTIAAGSTDAGLRSQVPLRFRSGTTLLLPPGPFAICHLLKKMRPLPAKGPERMAYGEAYRQILDAIRSDPPGSRAVVERLSQFPTRLIVGGGLERVLPAAEAFFESRIFSLGRRLPGPAIDPAPLRARFERRLVDKSIRIEALRAAGQPDAFPPDLVDQIRRAIAAPFEDAGELTGAPLLISLIQYRTRLEEAYFAGRPLPVFSTGPEVDYFLALAVFQDQEDIETGWGVLPNVQTEILELLRRAALGKLKFQITIERTTGTFRETLTPSPVEKTLAEACQDKSLGSVVYNREQNTIAFIPSP